MDVQSDASDPPPSDSQPGGKKKGFKLFGKRKPGSIFSIRGRAEEKEAATVARSKAPEGSPESAASPPEQEPGETERAPEVRGPGPNGQADGALQDEGVSMMAAAPSRPSICSMGSVRSMGFLLRLRGGGKGGRGGERQVQTVSQPPPGRQRRGIKGLFSGVKFPPNKGDQEEERAGAPPSPLLMSSRSNSVEIIKEDMTLTPRPPRNRNSSSESEGLGPASHDYGSAVVPRTPVSLGPGTPQEPGDAGLSFLLADISSLLTFDSITAGGDIMADVAAEWDKASAAISARDTEEAPPPTASPSPKPVVRSYPAAAYAPSVSAATSTRQHAAALPPATPPRSFTATVQPTAAPSSFTPPVAADIKSSTLSSHAFKPPSAASASPAAVPSSFITVRSSAQKPAAMPSSSLVTLTSFSTPAVKTSTLITTRPPLYPTSAAEPTPTKPPGVAPPYRSPLTTLSSVAAKPPAEAPVPAAAAAAREPSHAAPAPFTFTPVAYTLPSNLPFSPADKLDSRNGPSYQSASAKRPPCVLSSFTAGESRASVLLTCPVQAKPPSSVPPAVLPKTTVLPPAPLPPLPPCAPSLITSDKYAPSFAPPSVPSGVSSAPTPASFTKPPSVPAPVPPRTTSVTPAAHPAAAPAHLDETPAVPASAPLPTPQAAASALTLSSGPRPSAPASTAPPLASKTPPLPIPPPFFTTTPITSTPSPVTPTPSPVSPSPAPVTCLSASKAPTSSFVIPSPLTPVTRTPDPPVIKPAPAAPTQSSITPTPTPAPMSCTPASKPPTPASVIPTPILPTPTPVPRTPDAMVPKPAPITPTPVSIPVPLPKTSPPPPTTTPSGPGRVQASVEPPPGSLAGTYDKAAQRPARREEAAPAPAEPHQTGLPGPVREKRPTPGKLVGLSKIPIVGGGRGGKPPVRDAHPPPHGDDGDRSPDSCSTPGPTPGPTPAPTPASSPVDERPRLSPQDGRGRGAGVPTPRPSQHPEESQLAPHPQPPRAVASSPRDSRIPVKHGAQPTSQPPRSKIPTSKVPVRRLGASKPAVASTTAPQMRK
ncbi:proline-rich protein 36-like [Gadus macrocephalus]|uniref:proline-rich protein 36-like n=1 Tax=Gadus macrocephalus TaxID=80720 RepID=UPI0028CBA984|nr:proline-rich protein 36-like [Gadus macrocephalus]